MENLIKGWVTSLVGVAIMIGVILHGSGIYKFPNPIFLNTKAECLVAFLTGLALWVMPRTKIESFLERLFTKKVDKL